MGEQDLSLAEILVLMLQASQGDQEADDALTKSALSSVADDIVAVERLLGVKVEPGSFLLGMAQQRHGPEGFIGEQARDHYGRTLPMIRDAYLGKTD